MTKINMVPAKKQLLHTVKKQLLPESFSHTTKRAGISSANEFPERPPALFQAMIYFFKLYLSKSLFITLQGNIFDKTRFCICFNCT